MIVVVYNNDHNQQKKKINALINNWWVNSVVKEGFKKGPSITLIGIWGKRQIIQKMTGWQETKNKNTRTINTSQKTMIFQKSEVLSHQGSKIFLRSATIPLTVHGEGERCGPFLIRRHFLDSEKRTKIRNEHY